jgi:hypothetical protein
VEEAVIVTVYFTMQFSKLFPHYGIAGLSIVNGIKRGEMIGKLQKKRNLII